MAYTSNPNNTYKIMSFSKSTVAPNNIDSRNEELLAVEMLHSKDLNLEQNLLSEAMENLSTEDAAFLHHIDQCKAAITSAGFQPLGRGIHTPQAIGFYRSILKANSQVIFQILVVTKILSENIV